MSNDTDGGKKITLFEGDEPTDADVLAELNRQSGEGEEATYVYPDAVRQAVQDGNVVASIQTITLAVKDKDGNRTKYGADFLSLAASERDEKSLLAGMVALADGNMLSVVEDGKATRAASVAKYFNSGTDGAQRAAARGRLNTILEGPDKAIERAIEQLVKAGKTREFAENLVRGAF